LAQGSRGALACPISSAVRYLPSPEIMSKLLLLPTFATAQSVFGGYDVGTANVALAGVTEDILAIGDALPDNFATAKTIYTSGSGLTDPTLQKFAKGETGTYTDGATYKAFNSLFGSATMWDDLILASADDTLGAYGGTDTASFRKYGVNKGVLGACVFEALNLLEAALKAGPSAAAQDHVDKAWAVYYGSRADADASAAEVTMKREKASDFGAGTALVFSRLHVPFKQAKDALAATGGDADKAASAVKDIKKMIILTFARATIKYSHKRMTTDAASYSAGAHMEGDAYYRIFAGVALSFLENDADMKTHIDKISAKMAYTQAPSALTATTDHCDVKKLVEEMYVKLELDCDMVGIMPGLATCSTTCWENMGGEQYFYMPLSDVYSYATITKDVASMTSLTPDNFAGAKTVYENGENSVLKMKTIATTDHGTDPFFKAYETTFGSKTSFDDVISAALDGTGDMASKEPAFKAYVVAKCGITALNMETMTLLTKAATAAAGGDKSYAATGGAFLWDAAYATLIGVSGGKSVGGVCGKRDKDFTDGVQVRKMILKQFQAGKTAILAETFDKTKVDAAIAEIQRLVGITFARATIKYSSRAKPVAGDTPDVYNAGYHAEGFCYWRGMAGYFADKAGDKDTVLEIDALLALTKNDADIVQPALACDAKEKMEGMLSGLGVTCDELGTMTSNMHECETTCAQNVAAAGTADPDSRAPLAALGALVTAVIFA